MTNKKQKPIDKLVNTINQTGSYHVLSTTNDYLMVGRFLPLTVRIEKSASLFQPFGKNVNMNMPVFFPLVINRTKSDNGSLIGQCTKCSIPPLYLNKLQINWDPKELKAFLNKYIDENCASTGIQTT